MAGSITVPNVFANQSGPIPLAQLDTDLSTVYGSVNALLSFSNYYVDSSGTPNSIIVTVSSPQVVSYTAGLVLFVKVANTNSGASTITVNALGTNSIVTNTGGVIPAGALVAGSIVKLVYDGTNFQLLSFSGAGVAGGANTQVQFNNSGILAGSTNLTFNGTVLTAAGFSGPINGSVGATTPGTGAFTTLSTSGLLSANLGLAVTGAAFTTRGITDNATATAISLAAGGNITISTPTSGGSTITAGVASANGLVVNATGASVGVLVNGAAATQITGMSFGQSGQTQWSLYQPAGSNDFRLYGGTDLLTVSSTGHVTFAGALSGITTLAMGGALSGVTTLSLAGASGVTLTVAATAGTHSTKIADSANTSYNAGYLELPVNAAGSTYTAVLADAGKCLYYSGTGATTYTIPANGSVAYPVGTTLTFVNDATGATNMTIAITTDTLVLSPGGTTGSRTLAQFGRATAHKVTSTRWIISGTGLT